MNRETAEIEAARAALEQQPPPRPDRWDRASWMRGAMYALGWVINRRGATIPPLEAARKLIPAGDITQLIDDLPKPSPAMHNITRCVICDKPLSAARAHVDTCGERCCKRLLARQRAGM